MSFLHYTIFPVVKLGLFIRALLLDRILALEKLRVRLAYILFLIDLNMLLEEHTNILVLYISFNFDDILTCIIFTCVSFYVSFSVRVDGGTGNNHLHTVFRLLQSSSVVIWIGLIHSTTEEIDKGTTQDTTSGGEGVGSDGWGEGVVR